MTALDVMLEKLGFFDVKFDGTIVFSSSSLFSCFFGVLVLMFPSHPVFNNVPVFDVTFFPLLFIMFSY